MVNRTVGEVFWNFIISNKQFFKETWCWVLNVIFYELSRLEVNLTKEAADVSKDIVVRGHVHSSQKGGLMPGTCFPVFRISTSSVCVWCLMCLFQEKETKKCEPKEKYQKRQELDKEEKGRKEPKALKSE